MSFNAEAVTIGYSTFPDEQYVASTLAPGRGYIGYASSNLFELRMATSVHLQWKVPAEFRGKDSFGAGLRATNLRECRGIGENCMKRVGASTEDILSRYRAVLSYCKSATDRNCVLAVDAEDGNGNLLPGKILKDGFSGESMQNYVGDPKIDLPDGNSSFTVSIPGATHAKGDTYLVIATLDSGMSESSEKFRPAELQIGIVAADINYGNYPERAYVPSDLTEAVGTRPNEYRHPYLETCVAHNTGACVIPQRIPLDIKFKVKLRLSVPVSGWFHGRVTDTSIKIEKISESTSIYEISAKAVTVPMVTQWKRNDEISTELMDFYAKQPQPLGGTGDFTRASYPLGADRSWSMLRQQTDFSDIGMQELLLWLKESKDKAIATPTQWTLRTMVYDQNNPCYSRAPGFIGVVQTNATGYISGPPIFNSVENSLDYKVAGPHLMPSGELNRGTYDLLLDKDVAKCLYGFNQAPTKATVSVLSSDGKETAETVSLSENDAFIKLRASGFSYSSPTLRVKLTAPTAMVPAPQTAQTAMSSPSSPLVLAPPTKQILKVITCEKGRKTKYIEGKNPKCPKGYKLNR